MNSKKMKTQDKFRVAVAALFSVGFHAILLLVLLPSPVLGHAHHGDKKNSQVSTQDVEVAKGETQRGDVVTSGNINVEGSVAGDCVALGGSISITGSATGDITSVGGPVYINGSVTGDVVSVGAPITLGPQAAVTGDVTAAGGKLTKEKGAQVTGRISEANVPVVGKALNLLKALGVVPPNNVPVQTQTTQSYSYTRSFNFGPSLDLSFFPVFFLTMGLIVLLVAVILPKPVENIAGAIQGQFWKSAGIGLLVHILFLPGLLLLCISIIGIALIPLALLLCAVAWLLSLVAFGLVLARRVFETFRRPLPRAVPGILIGYVLLNSLSLLGKALEMAGFAGGLVGGILIFANVILFSCALMVGLGAVWTTRLGSRPLSPIPPAAPSLTPLPEPLPAADPPAKRKKRGRP